MRDPCKRITRGVRRVLAAAGIPVAGRARRMHRAALKEIKRNQPTIDALHATAQPGSPELEQEIEAQRRAIERLDVVAYIDRIGRRED